MQSLVAFASMSIDYRYRVALHNPNTKGGITIVFRYQDFSIVLADRNYNPTMVNPDFLRGSGVVPWEYELTRPPVLFSQAVQIIYQKRYQVEAQLGSINFLQGIDTETFYTIELPSIARRYCVTLTNLP